jgi:serine/threonine protein kinase
MTLAVGTRLGAYEILASLGAGGMGEVYHARDTRLGRFVAIKLVTGAGGGDARTQLQREARAAAALNHPHICTIHEIGEAGEAGEHLFIVMEHVDGLALSVLVAEGLSASTAVRYGINIADGLGHAHERGIVHRDLKSANVMVTRDGRVKILDFGIATIVGEEAGAATRLATSPGAVAGTLAYLAPEVLRGAPADRRADIWALGVVLYEMVSGTRPFAGATSFEVSSAILRDEPEALPRHVPVPVRNVIARCLVKEAALRYQHVGEVRAALEAIAAQATMPEQAHVPWPSRDDGSAGATRAALSQALSGTGPSADKPTASAEKSVLVLPFANLSPEADDA